MRLLFFDESGKLDDGGAFALGGNAYFDCPLLRRVSRRTRPSRT